MVLNMLCVLLLGASWLSWGLVKGAEYTGKAIHKGATKLREHITPEDKPTHVSPTVTKSLHVAKQATGGAVKVSQFLGKPMLSVETGTGGLEQGRLQAAGFLRRHSIFFPQLCVFYLSCNYCEGEKLMG